MEHVIEPAIVIEEIFRVLKPDGIVYAETPFMQQVHEGAYDFNRFTVLGHRYLFKKFKAISIGGNKGSEIVLAWSIKYFIWSLIRNSFIAKMSGIMMNIILRPFGMFISESSLFDSSSGVFFMGLKADNQKLSHKDLIGLYQGNIR